jgi:hypothetical protein
MSTAATADTTTKREELSLRQVFNKAAASAVRGGTAGAIAMGANVAALMWMRTTVRCFKFFDFVGLMISADEQGEGSEQNELLLGGVFFFDDDDDDYARRDGWVVILQLLTQMHAALCSTRLLTAQVNYQYRNGTSFPVALRTLYADGGIPRFYRVSSHRCM